MALADSRKKKKVNELLQLALTQSPTAVSQLTVAFNNLELALLNVHDSILNELGTYDEEIRADLNEVITPEFIKIVELTTRASALNAIFDEDENVYRVNFENYIADNAAKYEEAKSKIS